MKTVVQLIEEMATEIELLLKSLIWEHSSIHRWNFPKPDDYLIWGGGDYRWDELNDKGRQIQSKILEDYRRFQR
jgi:hypothetical protein